MSTFTATDVPVSRRSTGLRIFLWLLTILVLSAAAVIAYAYFVARAALPQLDGTLQVKGLVGAGEGNATGNGVPAVEAATLEDLFFAQGYVTAQDRLWQMDVMRRFGAENSRRFWARTQSRSTASSAFWDCERRRKKSLRWQARATVLISTPTRAG
jgi:hypothetical protein